MRLTPFVLAGLLVAAAATTPATAATRKPITKTYEASAPTPDPTNWLSQAGVPSYSVCAQNVPQSFHVHNFKAPALGKIKITLTEFTGDWDLLLLDSKGMEVAAGGASDVGSPGTPASETMTAKIKKKGATYKIIACNWAGGPTGTVKYVFTFS